MLAMYQVLDEVKMSCHQEHPKFVGSSECTLNGLDAAFPASPPPTIGHDACLATPSGQQRELSESMTCLGLPSLTS